MKKCSKPLNGVSKRWRLFRVKLTNLHLFDTHENVPAESYQDSSNAPQGPRNEQGLMECDDLSPLSLSVD